MKKTMNVSVLFAAAAIALAGCAQKELDTPAAGQDGVYTYRFAVASDDTKAVLDGNHVAFESGDRMGVYADAELNIASPVDVEKSPVEVSVTTSQALGAGSVVYAYYPYNAYNTAEASAVPLSIPVRQTQSGTSYDADAMPMVSVPITLDEAPSGDGPVAEFLMYNLGAVVEFNVYGSLQDEEKLLGVSFEAESGLAGDFVWNAAAEGEPDMSSLTFDRKKVSVNVTSLQTIGTSKDDAAKIYMVIAPGTYTGKVYITTTLADYIYNVESGIRFDRASIKPLGVNLSETSVDETDSYGIFDAQDLLEFATAANSGEELTKWMRNDEVYLAADIDMNGSAWTMVKNFSGVFNGNNKKIDNMVFEGASAQGLFNNLSGTVKDLIIGENSRIVNTSNWNVGGIVATAKTGAKIMGCVNKADVSAAGSGSLAYVGGVVGLMETGTELTDCVNEGDVSGKNCEIVQYIGGVLGYIKASDITVSGCRNYGTVQYLDGNTGKGNKFVGGVAANVEGGAALSDCDNYGAVKNLASGGSGTHRVGGVVACMGDVRISDCDNYGEVTYDAASTYRIIVGGVVGDSWRASYSNCTNSGKISLIKTTAFGGSCFANLGGIVGRINPDGTESQNDVLNCINRGNVTFDCTADPAVNNYFSAAGGIVGTSNPKNGNLISGCKNYGKVSGRTNGKPATGTQYDWTGFAGIVGYAVNSTNNTQMIIQDCENHGEIVAEPFTTSPKYLVAAVGGILGNGQADNGNIENTADDGSTSVTVRENREIKVLSCVNKGKIEDKKTHSPIAGGIVGNIVAVGTVSDCVNEGSVIIRNHTTWYGQMGGIVGRVNTVTTVTSCRNTGAVVYGGTRNAANDVCVGSIIGASYNTATISSCEAYGTVLRNLDGCYGSVVGRRGDGTCTVKSCWYNTKFGAYDASAADYGASVAVLEDVLGNNTLTLVDDAPNTFGVK